MADPVAIPAELTDALRSISPALEGFATMLENVLPALSSVIPAIGELFEAFEAFNPEILAAVEAIRFFWPLIQQLAPLFSSLSGIIQFLLMPAFAILHPAIVGLSAILAVLAAVLNPIGTIVNALGKAFDSVSSAAKSVANALSRVVGVVVDVLGKLVSGIASIASRLYSVFKFAIIDPLSSAIRSLVSSVSSAVQTFLSASFTMSGTSDLLRLMGGAIERFIGGITGGVGAIANAISPFIQALNPSVLFGLNFAFRSLQATIGTALLPVAQVLTSVIRQMSAALLPAAQALAPVLGKFAEVIGGFVVNSVQRFVQNLLDLLPFFNQLADATRVLVGAWEAVRAVVFAFVDSVVNWIKTLFTGGDETKDFLSSFRNALHIAVEGLIRFSVMLARSFGFSDFVDNLRTQLTKFAEPVKGSGAPPAPTDVGFKSFEDIAKTLASAAFAAQGGAGHGAEEKSEREWLKQLANSLDKIKDDGDSLRDFLNTKLADFAKQISEVAEGAEKLLVDGVHRVGNEIQADVEKKVKYYWNLFWIKEAAAENSLIDKAKGLLPF